MFLLWVGINLNLIIMKNREFKNVLNSVHIFNNLQFRLLKEEVNKRVKTKRISNILETPKHRIICPHCKSSNFILWGKRNDLQRYKCKCCTKTFNSLTKTPLARLRRKGHWLDYTRCLKEGLTIRKAAVKCNISKNTSFRWRHRFITNLKYIKTNKLGGIIESNQLILKESFKGNRSIKFEMKNDRKDVFIIYAIDRNNNIFDITNKGFNTRLLNSELGQKIIEDSLLYSTNNRIFSEFSQLNNFKHISIKTNKKIHKLSHTNKVDSYKSEFENWIIKHFKGVATKYLENYVSWFRSLKEFKSGINSITLLYRAKSIEKYRHQPLKVTDYV